MSTWNGVLWSIVMGIHCFSYGANVKGIANDQPRCRETRPTVVPASANTESVLRAGPGRPAPVELVSKLLEANG